MWRLKLSMKASACGEDFLSQVVGQSILTTSEIEKRVKCA